MNNTRTFPVWSLSSDMTLLTGDWQLSTIFWLVRETYTQVIASIIQKI